MAEALARALALDRGLQLDFASAGTAAGAGDEASPEAREAMARRGLDLSAHRARPLDAALLDETDLVLVMEPQQLRVLDSFPQAAGKARLLSEWAGEPEPGPPVADPHGGSPDDYDSAAELLEGYLARGLPESSSP